VDFTFSERAREVRERLAAFMDECVYPAEAAYARGRATSLGPDDVHLESVARRELARYQHT
jgi:hypothetical protein